MPRPLSYGDWIRSLGSRKNGPARIEGAFLFCGPETLQRDAALARVKEVLFGGIEQARLGHDRFHGGEGPLANVTSALASVGLFTGTRLVTISEPERSGRAGAAERRELLERLQGGLAGSVFVALSDLTVRELEKKNEFTKSLLQTCTVVEMNHPSPAEALRWLLDESIRRAVPLDPDAATLLLAKVGPSLQELSREIEKLEQWISPEDLGPSGRVDARRIEEMVRRGQLGTGWEFCEAVLNGRTAAALRLWSAVERTEPPLRIQWLLQRQARDRLSRTGGGADPGGPVSLTELLLRSFEFERGIKTGRIPSGREGTALEMLVLSSGAGRARPIARSRTAQ